MTLHDVEAVTQGEFKAASLSAYERGERSISVLRLLRIADVYKTSIDELIPPVPNAETTSVRPADATDGAEGGEEDALASTRRIRLDIDRLAEMTGPGWDQMKSVVAAIQQRRRGRAGRYLVLRGEDVWIVAAIFGARPRDVMPLLAREGLAQPG
jgi:transcriptional regulator with XRE-family HTH domain